MTDYKTIAESNNFIVLDKYNKEWKVAVWFSMRKGDNGLTNSIRMETDV